MKQDTRLESGHTSIDDLTRLVGRTPLIEFVFAIDGAEYHIYAKLETSNLTGSIKDRMALHIIRRARERGELRPADLIVEATSGNTGIALSAIGRALGHPVRIYMPDWMSRERVLLMQQLGATVVPVSEAEGGFTGAIRRAARDAEDEGVFHARQFENPDNPAAHAETTGVEIVEALREAGIRPTAFVAGVGTGGTVMGVGTAMRAAWREIRVHPLEPAESPTLREGVKVGRHRIQGISDDFIPDVVDLGALDEIVDASDGDAILMAQMLARDAGISVGISSGANVVGALALARRDGSDSAVVTVLADCGKKYLTTDLVANEPKRPHYLTPRARLLAFRVVHDGCSCR